MKDAKASSRKKIPVKFTLPQLDCMSIKGDYDTEVLNLQFPKKAA
jgi:hypothetical protein